MAFNLDHAKRMRRGVSRASGNKLTVQVGHQACSFGHMADVRQFLAEPERMGRITAVAMQMHRNHRATNPMVTNCPAHSGLLTPQNIASKIPG